MRTQPPLQSRAKRRLSRSIRTVLPACAMAWVLLSGSHPAGAAPSIEVHPSLTPVSLAASPDVLVVGHLSGWSILENWQGNGPAPELVAAQSAPRGPAVGRDDTLYFPAYFELGSKPSQGTVSWMRNLPTALEAATVDDKGGLYVAARASVVIFPEGIPGPQNMSGTRMFSS